MKSNKGITLVALVIYVIVMIAVLGILSIIITRFRENTGKIETDTEEILAFNHFNTYFLKEVKTKDNKIDNVNANYILFKSGNSFSFSNNRIYYNNIVICSGVKSFLIDAKEENGNYSDVVKITISFEEFTKSISYKLEQIY